MSDGWSFLDPFDPDANIESPKRLKVEASCRDPLLDCLEYSVFLGKRIRERIEIMRSSGRLVSCPACLVCWDRSGDKSKSHDDSEGCVNHWALSYRDVECLVLKKSCLMAAHIEEPLDFSFTCIADPWLTDAHRSPQSGRKVSKDFWAHSELLYDVGRLSREAGITVTTFAHIF